LGTQRRYPSIDTIVIHFEPKGEDLVTEPDRVPFRQARARSVLSVRELAARAGVAPATVYQIEHGRTRPHYRSIRLLSEALGVDPMQIVEFARVIEEGGAFPATKEDRTRTTTRRNP
jgi:DNA-binding XRE family transcriptional regulator